MSKVTKEVRALVEAKLRASIKLAEEKYGQEFAYPVVLYTKRGTTAGTAHTTNWEVNFNAVLLMENTADFLARTVPHEMAHLIDYQLHPENFESRLTVTRSGRYKRSKRSVHGPTWQNIMRAIGADPSRCHSYDVSNAKVKKRTGAKHVWKCKCGQESGTMKIGAVRHKKQLAANGGHYWMRQHKRCGGYSYFGLEGQEMQPMPLAAEVHKPLIPNRAHEGKTKLEICRMWFTPTGARKDMIRMFQIKAGCTPAGAATYYARLKKEAS